MKNLLYLLIAVLLTTANFAQKGDYSKEPGFVKFISFDEFDDGSESTEVLVEAKLLRMVSKMMDEKDKDVAEMVNGLKLVKVNQFKVKPEKIGKLKSEMEKIDKTMLSKDWDRIVRTRGDKEYVNVYIKTDAKDNIQGLVVTTVDETEAVFVNIVGTIDLEKIGKLSGNFDIPELDEIMKNKHKHSEKDNGK
jgi:hypothetical protein